MDERARRVGQNEALFREVNERIRGVNESFGALTGDFAIVCECGDGTCVEQLRIAPEEYERLRAEPTHFAVAPGHEIPDVEDVVETHGGYVVVRKRPGGPARLAAETDPRR